MARRPVTAKQAVPVGDRWHVLCVGGAVTGCGRDVAHLPLSMRERARDVDVQVRCQSPGCRLAWPAHLRLVG